MKPGDEVSLIVRPENCRIATPGGQSADRTTSLPATVAQVIYLGSSVKFELECMGTAAYVRSTPRPDDIVPLEGQVVSIEWDEADAVIVGGG
jgi:hypothetical protein